MLVATQNPNLAITAILLGAAVVPVVFVTFISGPNATSAPCR